MKPKSKPSTKSNEKIVRMRIVCVDPLEHTKHNAIFGVQDKKRVEHEGVKQSNGDIHYDIEVRAKCDVVDSINRFDLPETKKPNFLGPWTNGTRDKRFLYLSWKSINPKNPSPWTRRMKIHLSSITWEQVEEVDRVEHGALEVRVAGRDYEGAPACGSVSLGEGWMVCNIPGFKPIQPTN